MREMAENRSLRILIIEDSDDDAQLVLREIHRLGYVVESQRIESPEELHHVHRLVRLRPCLH